MYTCGLQSAGQEASTPWLPKHLLLIDCELNAGILSCRIVDRTAFGGYIIVKLDLLVKANTLPLSLALASVLMCAGSSSTTMGASGSAASC